MTPSDRNRPPRGGPPGGDVSAPPGDGRSGWSELAESYDRTRAFPGDGEVRVPREVARILLDRGVSSVLDVGCGTGRFAVPLAAEGLRVVGVDRSPEMLAVLRSKPGADLVRVVRGDLDRLPLLGRFDAVVLAHVLHLVDSPERLGAEIRRVLGPRAVVVDVDTSHTPRPATEALMAALNPHLGDAYTQWPRGGASRDSVLFDRLLAVLGGADVEIVAGPEFPVVTSLRRLLDEARRRTWWTLRRHREAVVLRAADRAERDLVAAGHDLDAPVDEPSGVRYLVASLR